MNTVWYQWIWWLQTFSLLSQFGLTLPIFWSAKVKNIAWHYDPGWQKRTLCTSHYPFHDPCRGQWTVWQERIGLQVIQGFKQSHFWLNFSLYYQNFGQPRPKTKYDIWPKLTKKNCGNAHAKDNGHSSSRELVYKKSSNSLTFATIFWPPKAQTWHYMTHEHEVDKTTEKCLYITLSIHYSF